MAQNHISVKYAVSFSEAEFEGRLIFDQEEMYFHLYDLNIEPSPIVKTAFINFVNASGAREINNQSFVYGLELRSGFLSGFNYHLGTEFRTSEVKTTQSNFSNRFSNTDNFSFLDLSYVFSDRFNMTLKTERYYFGNLDSGNNTYYFSDFSAMYITKDKTLNFGLSAKNLFNTQTFTNFTISDISTSTTSYKLLLRIIMLNVNFKF